MTRFSGLDRETLAALIRSYIVPVDTAVEISALPQPQPYFRASHHVFCQVGRHHNPDPQQQHSQHQSPYQLVEEDGLEYLRMLSSDSVDSIFLMNVLRGLDSDEGKTLLDESLRVARSQIVVFSLLPPVTDISESGLNSVAASAFDQNWHIFQSAEPVPDLSGDGSFVHCWAVCNCGTPDSLRLGVLSGFSGLPPAPSGQANMLDRLFRHWLPDRYRLFYILLFTPLVFPLGEEGRLPAKYIELNDNRVFNVPRLYRLFAKHKLDRLTRLLVIIANIYYVSRELGKHLIQEDCDWVVACTYSLIEMPVGFIASRIAKRPFCAYYFDWYAYQSVDPMEKRIAWLAEHLILRLADLVIVPNETLQEILRQRYGVVSTVIHNPNAPEFLEFEPSSDWPTKKSEIRIVYTGSVYHANADSLRNLAKAVGKIGRPELKLHIYTSQAPSSLALEPADEDHVIFHDYLDRAEVAQVQRKADILFLPLGFNSGIDEIIQTSAPGKMGEYLASGRPILVHAPPSSFLADYMQRHCCAVVVDEDNVAVLAEAIMKIMNSADLRETISEQARRRAILDFNPDIEGQKFVQLFLQS